MLNQENIFYSGPVFCIYALVFCVDSVVDVPVAVPHLVPLLMAMEGDDPVENSERGCQLLYNILQSARNAVVRAKEYQQHAHSLLTGTCARPHTSTTSDHIVFITGPC